MNVTATAAAMRSRLDDERAAGRIVGLVPTMGALHAGHASLLERARAERDVVALTIFVNPRQFAPGEDLDRYPRSLDADLRVAERHGADVVFAPSAHEMWGDDVATTVHVDGPARGLEGDCRPGHFDGVASVVAKLLNLAGPCRAYFGEKDYQQLAVIRRMVADLAFPVEVVGCPTVREPDGLALSSRNAYLDAEERQAAAVLNRALRAGVAAILAGERDPQAVQQLVAAVAQAEPLVELDYAEVRAADLSPLAVIDGDVRLLIAARVGATRLIDNLGVNRRRSGASPRQGG